MPVIESLDVRASYVDFSLGDHNIGQSGSKFGANKWYETGLFILTNKAVYAIITKKMASNKKMASKVILWICCFMKISESVIIELSELSPAKFARELMLSIEGEVFAKGKIV